MERTFFAPTAPQDARLWSKMATSFDAQINALSVKPAGVIFPLPHFLNAIDRRNVDSTILCEICYESEWHRAMRLDFLVFPEQPSPDDWSS